MEYHLSLFKDAKYKQELTSFPAYIDGKQTLYVEASLSAPVPTGRLLAMVLWVKIAGGVGSCNFSTNTANFRQNFDRQLRIFDMVDYECSKF